MAVYFAVPRERVPGERRVALIPEMVAKLAAAGHTVLVETGAGLEAQSPDAAYRSAGAEIMSDAVALYSEADIVLKVQPHLQDEPKMRSGTILVGVLQPLRQPERMAEYAREGVTSFSMDLMPRITRAQSMDVLSSQSTVSGYRAVLQGALLAERFFPMLMTAAGTIAPAKVLVIGAGVAGLQAIATARRLGAVVQGFDVRAASREQVESLGASFLSPPVAGGEAEGGYARAMAEDEEEHERQTLADPVRRSDVVITTAMVPGRPAPLLISAEMAESMHPGSVIVDLAAETGGNCALTKPGEVYVTDGGVIVDGRLNVPAMMPLPASQLLSRNYVTFLDHALSVWLKGAKNAAEVGPVPEDDQILSTTLITRAGEVVHAATRERLQSTPR